LWRLVIHITNRLCMNWGGNQKGECIEYHLLAIVIGLAILAKGLRSTGL
jgi:putative oxidoreductase